ncbi:MAG: hypothetical protein WCK53_08420 [Methanomicrobiales archaeon]
MNKTLTIFWEHTPDLSEIPLITSDTNKTFCELLKSLRPALEQEGIILRFTSRSVTGAVNAQSQVTLNGRSLGDLLIEVAEEQRRCEGRRCEMATPITFPILPHGNIPYQRVPDLIIRKVLLRASGII